MREATEMTSRPVPAGLSALASIRPTAETAMQPSPVEAANRALAQAHGFAARDTVEQRNRKRAPTEAVRSFTTRVNTRDANAFIEWCDNERISYREGFGRMVNFFLEAQARQ